MRDFVNGGGGYLIPMWSRALKPMAVPNKSCKMRTQFKLMKIQVKLCPDLTKHHSIRTYPILS